MDARRFQWPPVLLILLLGFALRVALAAQSPCLSRDGVKFCRQAQALGVDTGAALRNPEYEQHPLYPLALLGAQRVGWALLGGGADPVAWQNAGLAVSLLAGLGVMAATALLAWRIAQLLAPEFDANRVTQLATLLAAALPLHAAQSAEAMSDELHALLYLGTMAVVLGAARPGSAIGAGICAGFAFLTRPEGAVAGCGAALGYILDRSVSIRRRLALAGLVLGTMAAVATPYWMVAGKLSPKTEKETTAELTAPEARIAPRDRQFAAAGGSGLILAALAREDVAWYAAIPRAALEVFRAGRVVVPMLALPALCFLWRRMRGTRAMAIAASMPVHFSLTVLLVYRHGYLSPRHELVIVALLIPFSAIALEYLGTELIERIRRRRAGAGGGASDHGAHAIANSMGATRSSAAARGEWNQGAMATFCRALVTIFAVAPLVWYAVRVPNADAGYIREISRWITNNDAHSRRMLLMGGSSQSRIAFYADMRFQPWPENLPTVERQFAALREHLLQHRPAYFAIDLGDGRETGRNGELLGRLSSDADIGPYIATEFRIRRTVTRGGRSETAPEAVVYAFRWPVSTSQGTRGPLP